MEPFALSQKLEDLANAARSIESALDKITFTGRRIT